MKISDKFFNQSVLFFIATALLGVAVSYSKIYLFHLSFIFVGYLIIAKYGFKVILNKYPTKLHLFFFFIFIWYALSIIWSINTIYSIRYLFYVFIGSSISFIIVLWLDNREKLRLALKMMAAVVIIEIFFSLLEAFTRFRLPVSPFSFISGYFGRPDSLHCFTYKELESILITPTGFRWNPNNLGIMMSLALPFFLISKNPYLKYLASVALFVIVVMTGSRISITACCISVLFYFFMTNKKFFMAGILVYALSMFILVKFSDEINENKYGKEVYEITSLYDATLNMILPDSMQIKRNKQIDIDEPVESGVARKQLMINGWHAFIDSKGLGVGGGGSIAVQEKQSGYIGTKIKSMHNFWFEVLVEGGILMFLSFIIWYLCILWKIFKIWRRARDEEWKHYALSFLISASLFLFAAIGASSTIYFIPMWLLLGFLVSFININEHEKNQNTLSL